MQCTPTQSLSSKTTTTTRLCNPSPLRPAPKETQHQMASQTNSNLPARHLCVHPDAHHNDDESRSSTIHEQINLYLSATALILDAALRDFKHDRKQQHLSHDQHNNTDHDTDSTYKHSDGHLDKDPTVLTLDDALNNFRYTADQHPSHDTPDQHDTAVVTIPPPPHQH